MDKPETVAKGKKDVEASCPTCDGPGSQHWAASGGEVWEWMKQHRRSHGHRIFYLIFPETPKTKEVEAEHGIQG